MGEVLLEDRSLFTLVLCFVKRAYFGKLNMTKSKLPVAK